MCSIKRRAEAPPINVRGCRHSEKLARSQRLASTSEVGGVRATAPDEPDGKEKRRGEKKEKAALADDWTLRSTSRGAVGRTSPVLLRLLYFVAEGLFDGTSRDEATESLRFLQRC